jgi:hypothetical protein
MDLNDLRWKVVEMVDAGDLASVREVLATTPDLIDLEPWLHRSAEAGQPALVEFFLDAGLDVNQRGEYAAKENALCAAADSGNAIVVRLLLRRGAVAELESPERNPLFAAIQSLSLDCARELVESGIDIHRTYLVDSGRLKNALLFADEWGARDIAEYLRERGATLPVAKTPEPTRVQERDALIQRVTEGLEAAGHEVFATLSLGSKDAQVELVLLPPTNDFPFQTLFTVGLSKSALSGFSADQPQFFVELMMHLPLTWDLSHRFFQTPEYQWPAEWLKELAAGIANRTIVIPGQHVIISNDDPPKPLGAGTEQSCLLLLADFYDFSPVDIDQAKKVHFYNVIPLYTEERDREKENGVVPLLEAMSRSPGSLVVHPDRGRFI